MKILMVTPYLGKTYGGTSKVVTELASSLGQLGQSIDIVTTTANDASTLDVKTGSWVAQNDYQVRYFPTWHRNDLIVSPALLLWLSHHIKEYNLVHTHTVFAPLITFTHSLCRFYKVPYLVTPHGMLEPWALSYKAWKKKLYYRAFEKAALSRASVVHVLAQSEAEQVQILGNSQTVHRAKRHSPKGILSLLFSKKLLSKVSNNAW